MSKKIIQTIAAFVLLIFFYAVGYLKDRGIYLGFVSYTAILVLLISIWSKPELSKWLVLKVCTLIVIIVVLVLGNINKDIENKIGSEFCKQLKFNNPAVCQCMDDYVNQKISRAERSQILRNVALGKDDGSKLTEIVAEAAKICTNNKDK